MCGIAGVLWREPRHAQSSEELLGRMRGALHHRGPDDRGVEADAHCALINTRLAIRDLSPAGHMPMRSSDGNLCITYNGEIYNAHELRRELTRLGHTFHSHSDTEVVLAGYKQWRDDVPRRLRGMFAFVVWDNSGKLFAARDPLGIKPLYYVVRPDAFAFASEIKSLREGGFVSGSTNPLAVSAFLQLGSIPAPLTIYNDVRALEPGHHLEIDTRMQPRIVRYYEMPSAGEKQSIDVIGALRDAVHSHLVADVEVGAFLSGGLDSSAVVALAAEKTSNLTTCAVSFGEVEEDESAYARIVSDRYQTRHHEVRVTHRDFIHALPQITAAMDQPSIDGFNTWFISRAAADVGLKVVLSGLGGDELFGGYPTFRGVPRMKRALQSVRAVRGSGLITRVARGARWRKVADAARRDVTNESAYLTYRGLFTRSEAESLYNFDRSFDAAAYVRERAEPASSNGEWVTRAELGTYTANQLLRDADVMSMAHSIELRVPLLDTWLVNEVMSWPVSARLSGPRKATLREAMRDKLPAEVLDRRVKRGFTFPMQRWLAAPAAAHLWDGLTDIKKDFDAGRVHWSRVWALMVLRQWQVQ